MELAESQARMKIYFRSSEDAAMLAYFNVTSNGEIVVCRQGEHERLGSIFKTQDLNKLLEVADFNYEQHYEMRAQDKVNFINETHH